MENFKKIRSFLVVILVAAMIVSFVVLKVKQSRNDNQKVDNQIVNNQNNQNNDQLVTKITGSNELRKFADYDELKSFLENNLGSGTNYSTRGMMMEDTVMAPGAAVKMLAPSAVSSNEAGAMGEGRQAVSTDDYSRTNVQVAGVDEADIIKTDGNYIYATTYNDLYIIKAYPGEEAEIVSKIQFKSRPQELYIDGDSLVVFGNDDRIYDLPVYQTFRRQNSYTFFKVFDITDKKNPKQVRDLDFEGYYFNSRLIGDYVYFVTNNWNYYMTPDPIMPRILDGGTPLAEKCSGTDVKCFAPSVYYFDIPYDSYNFTSITAINIKNHEAKITGDVYLMSAGQNMYVSQDNIYITYTKYISEYDLQMEIAREIIFPKLSAREQTRITQIEAIDDSILSKNEKRAKVQQVLERYLASLTIEEQEAYQTQLDVKMKQKYQDLSKELEKTVIYKIAVAKDKMEYKSSGEVTGSVLNQFSMDENNGYFRIATTKNQTWSRFESERRESYNNLYVLDENLKTVGRVEDLATGERIYSVRFMGNRAYLVTFKQTDPLFAIDLSDPKAPKVLGELKVPGFSSYLHPYDENTLIGFGKDAEDLGDSGVKIRGLKLSLFDVRDVSNPKELDTYLLGDMGSDSIALYDHKAFLFSKEKNILVVPVHLTEASTPEKWGNISFSGVMAFKFNNQKFELLGKIAHDKVNQRMTPDYWGGVYYYDNSVQRSLYIKDNLYTLSHNYLKVNKLSDLKEVKNVELKKEKQDDFEIIN